MQISDLAGQGRSTSEEQLIENLIARYAALKKSIEAAELAEKQRADAAGGGTGAGGRSLTPPPATPGKTKEEKAFLASLALQKFIESIFGATEVIDGVGSAFDELATKIPLLGQPGPGGNPPTGVPPRPSLPFGFGPSDVAQGIGEGAGGGMIQGVMAMIGQLVPALQGFMTVGTGLIGALIAFVVTSKTFQQFNDKIQIIIKLLQTVLEPLKPVLDEIALIMLGLGKLIVFFVKPLVELIARNVLPVIQIVTKVLQAILSAFGLKIDQGDLDLLEGLQDPTPVVLRLDVAEAMQDLDRAQAALLLASDDVAREAARQQFLAAREAAILAQQAAAAQPDPIDIWTGEIDLAFLEFWEDVKAAAKWIRDKLVEAGDYVKEKLMEAADYAKRQLKSAADYLKDQTMSAADYLKTQLESAADNLKTQLESAANYAKRQLKSAANYAKRQLKSAADYLRNQLESAANYADTQLKSAADYLENQLKSAADYFKTQMKSLIRWIKDRLGFGGGGGGFDINPFDLTNPALGSNMTGSGIDPVLAALSALTSLAPPAPAGGGGGGMVVVVMDSDGNVTNSGGEELLSPEKLDGLNAAIFELERRGDVAAGTVMR